MISKVRMASFGVLMALAAHSHAQTLEDAVNFIFCPDTPISECAMKTKVDGCSVEVTSSAIPGGLYYRLHFERVIWNSLQIDFMQRSVEASCQGECMEDPNGDLARLKSWLTPEQAFMNGFQHDPTRLALGFTVAPQRVRGAWSVVQRHCPGVISTF